MDDDESIHRLDGIDNTGKTFGLILKKDKHSGKEQHVFKKPSLLGLEKLAKEKREQERDKNSSHRERNYRPARVETPSYTGGVSDSYKERAKNREERHKRDRINASSDKKRKSEEQHRSSRGDSDRKVKRYDRTPTLSDRRGIATPSRSGWEEEESGYGSYRSKRSWESPSPAPSRYDRSERSHRPTSSRRPRGTPLPTPAHRYNSWADERKHLSETPTPSGNRREGKRDEDWEEMEKQADRDWYMMDEGYDEANNPFATASEEYVQKREQHMKTQRRERISAQRKQINEDNEKWETNRMMRSGVVLQTKYDEDFEEDNAARVHLLVHNIVPPFLDGRIVFTKQFEPVIPVRDVTSDMAIVSRKGSLTVRKHREMKERKKAQKKEWELAGTNIGNTVSIHI